MMPFLALHRIAAQRGEGLRPELISLLERWGCSERDRTSPATQAASEDRVTTLSSPDLTPHDTDTSDESSPCPALIAGVHR